MNIGNLTSFLLMQSTPPVPPVDGTYIYDPAVNLGRSVTTGIGPGTYMFTDINSPRGSMYVYDAVTNPNNTGFGAGFVDNIPNGASRSYTIANNVYIYGNYSEYATIYIRTYGSYLISGAGDSGTNGTYLDEGNYTNRIALTYNSRHIWGDGSWWYISGALGSASPLYYVINSASMTPPLVGWQNISGASPAPTLVKLT